MPSLIRHSSGSYYIVYSIKGKRIWRTLETRDRNLAQAKFVELEPKPLVDNSAKNKSNKITPRIKKSLQSAIDDFLQHVKVNTSISTQKDYQSVMKLFKMFVGPDKDLLEITLRDIERFKNEKYSSNVSPQTVNHNIRAIKAFFNRLVLWEVIDKSPCKGIKMLRIVDTVRPYFSREDLQGILACTTGTWLHSIILFAVLTGLRLGEIINLSWDDIILDKRKIIVRSNGTFRTKSGKIRMIPISTELLRLLEAQQDRTGLLFKDDEGKQFRGEFVSKKFKQAVRTCNLNDKLHFHSLRHTFGSYLVEQGVSLFHVQQLMGHSSPFVTQIYAHLGTAELMSSVEKINLSV